MSAATAERRLAAILAADVVGFSRLIGADEAGTLARLRMLHAEVVEPLMAEHHGRVFKTTGDGVLAEFASVVQALRCAIGMQERLRGHEMQLRIGVHQGDVVVEGGDLLGDGVNVAARLEGMAEPGGICISGRVREDAVGKLTLEVEDLGEPELKNIAQRYRVFRVRPGTPERQVMALSSKPSLAVLPFQNMSGDAEQEYFVDGIVEDIITGLSRIRWLYVAARNSTFTYKGRQVDIKEAGRKLGVRYILEGSLRKAGSRVRLTGQLIECETGMHVWAERYDRALGDIFELQDELTANVVGAIEPNLRHAEIERVKRKRPDSLDAYDLYLRALPLAHISMPNEAGQALALLERALAFEPDYPAAHATAAWCHEMRYMRDGQRDADRRAAIEHARAAIEGGADDAGTLSAAGFTIGLVAHDYPTAMRLIDQALDLTGASAQALWMGATVLVHAGDFARAVEYCERGLRVTPFGRDTSYLYLALAMAHCGSGDFEAAVAACVKGILTNPRFSLGHAMHAAALYSLGRTEEANAAATRVLECEPAFTVSGFVRSHAGHPEIWQPFGDAMRGAGLPE